MIHDKFFLRNEAELYFYGKIRNYIKFAKDFLIMKYLIFHFYKP